MDIFNVSASAMEAQRMRMNTVASNMANAQSTRTEAGGPYVKKEVSFASMQINPGKSDGLVGVKVNAVVEDQKPPMVIHDPGHPDADENGNVSMPNINVMEEMVNMMMALRAYEANVKALICQRACIRRPLR